MPELPEVEVTKRGIEDKLKGKKIVKIIVRNPNLRYLIQDSVHNFENSLIYGVTRRAKYIFILTSYGTLIIHLGMTGHLSFVNNDNKIIIGKHDHYDLELDDGIVMRYTDPRRFGLLIDTTSSPYDLSFISKLGPEPLTDDFNFNYLFSKITKKNSSIKHVLMDNEIIVGVGNIYANEVLFKCRIHPKRKANSITSDECQLLVKEIKSILKKSIESGGTTIRDYAQVDGRLGYFVQNLLVYSKNGEHCPNCGCEIETIKQGQRSTFFCPKCQK